MEIVNINIEDIKPYQNNPRLNELSVEYLVKVIKEFGFLIPLVIDVNNIIVAGHTRYEALKKLKYKKVPCIIADDLNDDEVKAYRLVDNKVAELSSWDYEKLRKELQDIKYINLDEFGFFNDDIEVVFEENKTTKKIKNEELICPCCNKIINKEELIAC